VAELLKRIRDGSHNTVFSRITLPVLISFAGSCVEAFGAGTAAVVAPVKSFLYKDEVRHFFERMF
jgi:hypothetical protein